MNQKLLQDVAHLLRKYYDDRGAKLEQYAEKIVALVKETLSSSVTKPSNVIIVLNTKILDDYEKYIPNYWRELYYILKEGYVDKGHTIKIYFE
jgi:hypothetical protein